MNVMRCRDCLHLYQTRTKKDPEHLGMMFVTLTYQCPKCKGEDSWLYSFSENPISPQPCKICGGINHEAYESEDKAISWNNGCDDCRRCKRLMEIS